MSESTFTYNMLCEMLDSVKSIPEFLIRPTWVLARGTYVILRPEGKFVILCNSTDIESVQEALKPIVARIVTTW